MVKVDTWLGTPYDIYLKDGLYYIVCDGEIISPGFATLKSVWDNGWKYKKKDSE